LHRVLATKPDKVYRAFIEADAMAKWLPPNGFTCTVHHLDAKVGGTYRMSFRNFTTGMSHSFGGSVHHTTIRGLADVLNAVGGAMVLWCDGLDYAKCSAGRASFCAR
jgi:hypothetical protein